MGDGVLEGIPGKMAGNELRKARALVRTSCFLSKGRIHWGHQGLDLGHPWSPVWSGTHCRYLLGHGEERISIEFTSAVEAQTQMCKT